jgi:hypothetical protein
MKLLYWSRLNFIADEELRNRLMEVERENILAKQDDTSSRVALEQERKKVRHLADDDIIFCGSCAQRALPPPPEVSPPSPFQRHLHVCSISGLAVPL